MEWLKTFCGKWHRWLLWLAFPALSLAMHSFLFDLPLQGIHAWRQCETASNITLFATTDQDILNPHVYSLLWENGLKRMEFPVMQWLFSRAVRVFGDHVFVLRLLSWMLGFLTVVGFMHCIDLLLNDKFIALAGAWCWMFSPVIFYYSINPLPDNFSLMCAVWGIAAFLKWYRSARTWAIMACFACLAVATSAKLPFVLFIALPIGALLGDLIQKRGRNLPRLALMGLFGLAMMAPALAWYVWVIPQWTGNGVVSGILDLTAEDIPEILYILEYNLLSILPELLVNYASLVFFLWGIWRVWGDRLFRHRLAFPFGMLAVSAIAYFIFEINMISTIHDYYLFPFLPGIFLIVAIGLQDLAYSGKRWVKMLSVLALLILPFTAGLRAYSRWSEENLPEGLLENIMESRSAVTSDAKIIFGNDPSPHISLYHLRHFGWTVDEKNLDSERFQSYLQQGAQFLYSNSRSLERNDIVSRHLENRIGEWGNLWVWRLK
jgi:Dolichyl-phosphate-mannose-protein mannosyltransferase